MEMRTIIKTAWVELLSLKIFKNIFIIFLKYMKFIIFNKSSQKILQKFTIYMAFRVSFCRIFVLIADHPILQEKVIS